MWKACLSEAVVADILKKHYIVVSDPVGAQNNTSFGVKIWMQTADGKELRNYWWGTGNCLIGSVFTEEYHRKRVKEMVRVLTEARQIAAGDLKAAGEVTAAIKSVLPDKNTITVSLGYGKDAKEQDFTLSSDTQLVNGINERTDVKPLADGIKDNLLAPGNGVRIATRTDMKGATQVLEVRVTGVARRR